MYTTSELKQRGDAILVTIATVRAKRQEQEALLRALEQQARLMLQGINPEQVTGYGYDPHIDPRGEHLRQRQPVYNTVRLADGRTIALDPPLPQHT